MQRKNLTTGYMSGQAKRAVAKAQRQAKVLAAYQPMIDRIKAELAADAASWESGRWSEEREERLRQKGIAIWQCPSLNSHEATRLGEERRLLDKLAFIEARIRAA